MKWLVCEYPSVPHRPPQFNTSIPHKDQHRKPLSSIPLSSTLKTLKFNTPLTSTPKTSQFNTKAPSVPHRKPHTPLSFFCLRGVMNWGVFGAELRGFWCGNEGCFELRGFKCGTEGLWGLKRSCPFVLNWGRPLDCH